MRWRASEVSRVRPMLEVYRPVCSLSRRWPPFFIEFGSPSALHSAESRKTDVFVQNFDLGEPDLTQQIELEQQRTGRVFLLDVGEHMVPVGFILEPGQVLAVAP